MITCKNLINELSKLTKSKLLDPLPTSLAIYIVSIFIIGAWNNFPLNDDFYFFTQVKAFSLGIFTKSAITNPTFILQGFMGLLWSKLFGLSYNSLRVMTVLISILSIIGLDKILKELKIKNKLRFITLLLIIFNPIFYASSLTFMTENYFLFFVIWSLYYFLLFTKRENMNHLLTSSIIGGMSVMVRQFGVVLFITYIFVYLLANRKKVNLKGILSLTIPFIILGAFGLFWPKFKYLSDPKSIDTTLFFANLQNIISRLTSIEILPYIGFFLVPFTIPMFVKLKTRFKLVSIIFSLPLALVFYNMNIFKMGNLIYLEGLYARLLVNIRQNVFNNIPFKLLIACLISLSIVLLTFYLVEKLYLIISKKQVLKLPEFNKSFDLILLILLFGFYLIAIIPDKTFDRYLVNFLIILVIYAAYRWEKENFHFHKISLMLAIFVSLIIYLMTFDYYKCMQLKWSLADKLIANEHIDSYQIFIDNVYVRAVYIEKNKNYDGRLSVRPQNYRPICYIQEYTRQQKNWLNSFLTYIESRGFVRKHFPNKYIAEAGLLKERNKKLNPVTDIVYYNEEYPSPVYNLLGRKIFVRAFCTTSLPIN